MYWRNNERSIEKSYAMKINTTNPIDNLDEFTYNRLVLKSENNIDFSKPFLLVNRRFNTKLEKKYDLEKIMLCDALKESIQLLKELYWVENSIDANIAKIIGNAKHTYTKWPKIELDKPDDAATFSQWLANQLKDFVSSRKANSIINSHKPNTDIKCAEDAMKEALRNLMLWK